MPIIEMHLIKGRSAELKRKALAAMTEAVCTSLSVRPEQVRILITEHSSDNFAIAGKTAAEINAAIVPPVQSVEA